MCAIRRAALLAVTSVVVSILAGCNDDGADKGVGDSATGEVGTVASTSTAFTTASVPQTTTAVLGPRVHINFTDGAKWTYSFDETVSARISFKKDISSSPPGKAAIVTTVQPMVAPTARTPTNPGRSGPPILPSAALFYPGVGYPNGSSPGFCRGSSNYMLIQGLKPVLAGTLCFAYNRSADSNGRAVDGGIDEVDVDRFLAATAAMKPQIMFLIGDIGSGGCGMYALIGPDGTPTIGGDDDAKSEGCLLSARLA